MFDIIIIGAGPAGMMAAITAAKNGADTIILEQNKDIGKKLLATGNGKCNYTNKNMNVNYFRGNEKLIKNGLNRFNEMDVIEFFSGLGILPYDNNGYIYPNSKQAQSIVQALRMELSRLKVNIRTDFKVTDIKKKNDIFDIKSDKDCLKTKKIVIAAGLKASPKLGSDGSIFNVVKSLNHSFLPVVPALCGFYCEGLRFNKISGVRCDCKLKLFSNNSVIAKSEGELQITDYGVSGIPVFQVSRYASLDIAAGKTPELEIDFMPCMSDKQLSVYLKNRIESITDKRSINEMLNGMLNQKLTLELIHKAKISPDKKAVQLDDTDINQLVSVIKHLFVKMKKPRDFEFAQVCAGGIDTDEICVDTLESKKCKNLYFCGEILDVDGICGGYNLQWAWSSGYIAGMESSK